MHSSRMRTVYSSGRISGGGCTCPEVYLVRGVPGLGRVYLPRGCTWSRGCTYLGVYLVWRGTCPGGVPGPKGVYLVRYSPHGQTHACKNITFATSLWTVKMMSLVNKSADWPPNYHKILMFSPPKSLKKLCAARIDELAD